MKSFSCMLVTVIILSPVSVVRAQQEGPTGLPSRSGTPSPQVNAVGCQIITGEFPEFPRTECSENGTKFQRIVLNPKTVLRKFDADYYDFRHSDALDPEQRLKNLDTLLARAWLSNEGTVLRVDFSKLDKFDWTYQTLLDRAQSSMDKHNADRDGLALQMSEVFASDQAQNRGRLSRLWRTWTDPS